MNDGNPDPLQDPEGIALVEGILNRVGHRRPAPPTAPVVEIDLRALSKALAGFGVALLPWQLEFLKATQAMNRLADNLRAEGVLPGPPPADLRARALWAKKRQGKGPPSSTGWRGRERNTKYRSQ